MQNFEAEREFLPECGENTKEKACDKVYKAYDEEGDEGFFREHLEIYEGMKEGAQSRFFEVKILDDEKEADA